MHCGWPANQVEVAGLVDSQCLVDVAMRVDICGHGSIQRQTAEGEICANHHHSLTTEQVATH